MYKVVYLGKEVKASTKVCASLEDACSFVLNVILVENPDTVWLICPALMSGTIKL